MLNWGWGEVHCILGSMNYSSCSIFLENEWINERLVFTVQLISKTDVVYWCDRLRVVQNELQNSESTLILSKSLDRCSFSVVRLMINEKVMALPRTPSCTPGLKHEMRTPKQMFPTQVQLCCFVKRYISLLLWLFMNWSQSLLQKENGPPVWGHIRFLRSYS